MDAQLLKAIMYLLVGVSVLLCGMKMMSSGLKKVVGKGLRGFFKKTQNNPFAGMGIGTAVTALVQSSDATAALVIGFINAGAMTMYQGLSIILGAYIGTTVTGVLASFSSLSISIYLLAFAFIGTVLMFFNKDKVKNIGEILCGFGLLFFGLAVMKDSFKNPDISNALTNLFSNINSPILLFVIGILVTAMVQSSSAISGIAIAMVGGGALSLNSALYIVLGATLGTVTNTLLASIGGTVDAKRTAWIAFAMRAMTAAIALIIVWIFENPIANLFHNVAINGSDEFPVALFTVVYNLIFMPLMIPCIKPMIKLFSRFIKTKENKDIINVIHFIDDKQLKYPEIALMQVRQEIINMYDIAYENYKLGLDKIVNYSNENTKEIIKLEDQTDYLNDRITDFLIKLANVVSKDDERKVGSYFHVINDIERIGDHAFNFHESAEKMNEEELYFSNAAKEEIAELNRVLCDMFDMAREIFANKDRANLSKLHEYEELTDKLKDDFYSSHYERVIKEQCSTKMTPYISTLIVELERIADHLTNIGYSIVNPVGDEQK